MNSFGEDKYKFLFVVESDSKEHDSDFIYIRKLMNKRYSISEKGHKLEPIYCKGKGNITRQETKIKKAIKNYKGKKTFVFICADIDTPEKVGSYSKNDDIYKYCIDNGYNFVWFKFDIENVFIGHEVDDTLKTKIARNFFANGDLTDKILKNMKKKTEEYESAGNHTSNFLSVIDNLKF